MFSANIDAQQSTNTNQMINPKYRIVQAFIHLPVDEKINGQLLDNLILFAKDQGTPLTADEEGIDRFSDSVVFDRSHFDTLQPDC